MGRENAALPEPTASHANAQKRADSHQSGARCVRRTHATATDLTDNGHQTHLENILPIMKTLAMIKKLKTYNICLNCCNVNLLFSSCMRKLGSRENSEFLLKDPLRGVVWTMG